jgi:two-component system, response regulator RegA
MTANGNACVVQYEATSARYGYSAGGGLRRTTPAEVAPARRGDRGWVLVADPDQCHSQGIANALEQDGWNVEVASCPTKFCFDVTRAADAQGCILELCPEGKVRFDYLRLLRQRCPQARILVTTAYPSFRVAVAAIRLGADDYAVKPITATELAHMLSGRQDIDGEVMSLPSLQRVEWEYINRVLGHTDGNISAAARLLGVERSTLQRKLRKRPPTR